MKVAQFIVKPLVFYADVLETLFRVRIQGPTVITSLLGAHTRKLFSALGDLLTHTSYRLLHGGVPLGLQPGECTRRFAAEVRVSLSVGTPVGEHPRQHSGHVISLGLHAWVLTRRGLGRPRVIQ